MSSLRYRYVLFYNIKPKLNLKLIKIACVAVKTGTNTRTICVADNLCTDAK